MNNIRSLLMKMSIIFSLLLVICPTNVYGLTSNPLASIYGNFILSFISLFFLAIILAIIVHLIQSLIRKL